MKKLEEGYYLVESFFGTQVIAHSTNIGFDLATFIYWKDMNDNWIHQFGSVYITAEEGKSAMLINIEDFIGEHFEKFL